MMKALPEGPQEGVLVGKLRARLREILSGTYKKRISEKTPKEMGEFLVVASP